jgi:uncharacterized RDD family membrane protein YckC
VYYLHLNDQQTGPFALEYLQNGWKQGTLSPDTLFWREGMAEWQPLESMRSLLDASDPPSIGPPPMVIAGFWRRLAAFAVDLTLLGSGGYLSGLILFDRYAALGAFGPVVGLIVAAVYFGILNSRLGGAQTPGKRLLGIRVTDAAGTAISPGRSLVRLLLLWVPGTLNNIIDLGLVANLRLASFLTLPLIVWYAVMAYLFVFNRRSRQTVHDLLAGTYVVRTNSPQPALSPSLWRGHLIVAGVLVIVLGGLDAAGTLLSRVPVFARMFAVHDALMATGQYRSVSATEGPTYVYSTTGSSKTEGCTITVRLKTRPATPQAAAAQVALLALKADPGLAKDDWLNVSVSYGYDIGIASGSVASTDRQPPAAWPSRAAALGVH